MTHSLQTPVAFLVFNRPEQTARVFAEIARARPKQLLIVADGPRADRLGEAQRCAQVREVVSRVDWPCDVRTNFSDTNLGCRRRVASGLDWVFDQVEATIVLEDDCLPDPTLFRFMDEMLAGYRDDARIMMVTGTNPLGRWKDERQSYHLSYCGSIWGWGSWRRAWKHYDVDMRLWRDDEARQRVRDVFAEPELYESRLATYEKVARGEVDTWDMQWSFARIINSGLSVVPAVNLISNIGFGADATHTIDPEARLANLPSAALSLPLTHPRVVAADDAADAWTLQNVFGIESRAADQRRDGPRRKRRGIRYRLRRMLQGITGRGAR